MDTLKRVKATLEIPLAITLLVASKTAEGQSGFTPPGAVL
jgi:hypothetical protein